MPFRSLLNKLLPFLTVILAINLLLPFISVQDSKADDLTAKTSEYSGIIAPTATSGNKVTVTFDENFGYRIYGGLHGNTSNTDTLSMTNQLAINGNDHTISDRIVGGYALSYDYPGNATASGNIVEVNNLTSTGGGLYGGFAYVAHDGSAIAENNTVTLNSYTGGDVIGGQSMNMNGNDDLKSNGNKLNVNNSTITGSLHAGQIFDSTGTSSTSTASMNTLKIENSKVTLSSENSVAGGYVDLEGLTNAAHVTAIENNGVEISNSQIVATVFGGYVISLGDHAVVPASVAIKNNSVEISNGSKVTGSVFGGFNNLVYNNVSADKVYTPTGNSVTLKGAVVEGLVSGGGVFATIEGRIKGNTVTFDGDDATINTAKLVQASGDLYIKGGFNTISGKIVSETSSFQVTYTESTAEKIIVTGGNTTITGDLKVYDSLSISKGEIKLDTVEIGALDDHNTDDFIITGGKVTVNNSLWFVHDRESTVKVSAGELIFNDNAFLRSSLLTNNNSVNLEVNNQGKVYFKSGSYANLDTLKIIDGTVTFDYSTGYFNKDDIDVTKGTLNIINGSTLSGVGDISIGNGAMVSVSDSSITGTSFSVNVLTGGNLSLSDASIIGLTKLTANETSKIAIEDSGLSITGDFHIKEGAEVKVSAGSGVTVASGSTTVDGAILNISGVSTFTAGTVLNLSGQSKLTATASNLLAEEINVNGNSVLSLSGGSIASATTKEFNVNGSQVTLNDSAIIANAFKVNSGGKLDTLGNSGIQGNVTVGSRSVLDVAGTFNVVGALDVGTGGTVNLGTGQLIATDNVSFADQTTLAITVDSATSHGSITSSSGTIVFDDGVTFNLALASSLSVEDVKSGITLFSATGGVTGYENLKLTGEAALLMELTLGSSGIELNYRGADGFLDQVATNNSFSVTSNYAKAGALVAAIENDGGHGELAATIRNAILDLNNLGPREAEIAFKQLIGESLLEVTKAVSTVALKTLDVVHGRLDTVRSLPSRTTPAAGSPDALNRLWVEGFATWARQSDQNNVPGYKFRNTGIALGYDRRVDALAGLTLGASLAFSAGELNSNTDYTTVDIDTFGIGIYGSYAHQSGFFVDAAVNYARSTNKADVYIPTGAKKESKFNIDTWQYAVRFGYEVKLSDWAITPSIGLRYLSFTQDAFSERVFGNAPALYVSKRRDDLLEIPFLVKVAGRFEAGPAIISPEFRVGYTYAAVRPSNITRVGFVGYDAEMELHGIDYKRDSFQVGAGVKIESGSFLDFFANYDLNAARNYTEHRASFGVGFEF